MSDIEYIIQAIARTTGAPNEKIRLVDSSVQYCITKGRGRSGGQYANEHVNIPSLSRFHQSLKRVSLAIVQKLAAASVAGRCDGQTQHTGQDGRPVVGQPVPVDVRLRD